MNPDDSPSDEYPRWWAQIDIGGANVRALLDTGCARTAMGPVALLIASSCGRKVRPYNGFARVANRGVEPILGQVELPFKIANARRNLNVIIVQSLDADCMLGVDFFRTFNAHIAPLTNELVVGDPGERIPIELASIAVIDEPELSSIGLADITSEEQERLQNLLDRVLPGSEAPLGCTKLIEHRIEVGDAKPIKKRYYPVSKRIEEEMHAQVRKMLEAGIIRRSNSQWSSPVVMVRKPDGSYRFCIDYRGLNALSKVCAYPLPYMDEILRKLQRAKYISVIDLSSAYHQIPLTEESKPLTAFTVPGMGLFEFNRLPYGVAGGPATFQELSDVLIGPEMEPYAFSYIDDTVVVTETFEEHLYWLERVLTRIKEAGLTINREKSKFGCKEVRFLGVLVNLDGFKPDPEKIQPIVHYPRPKNLKQLRRFMGMASWYRKFLDNFATVAEPLTRLTKANAPYDWGEEQEAAFTALKSMIASAPVLGQPSFEHQFVLQTDASDTGLGAVLTQTIDGVERVLSFASRVLSDAERNYSVTERECLAVIWAVRKFRHYLEGYKFKVITDHSSLKWLCNLKNPTGRLARWALELQSYEYEIEHRKGSLNCVPDALSRMYEDDAKVSLASMQMTEETTDTWYNKIYKQVLATPTELPNFKIVSGRLYFYKANPAIEGVLEDHDAWKLVIPKEKRDTVLHECHDEPTAGHLGRHKTYERVALFYYWPSMHKDVTEYVKGCLICQQVKAQQLAPAGLMGKRVVSRPWEMVSGDTMGPFPRSPRGNQYLLVFQDAFTRWIECVAVRNKNAKTILKELEERVFLRFGLPEVFHSDNGTEFKNATVEKFLEERGVVHTTVPPYHAQANPVERVNRSVKTMIVAYLEKAHSDWDAHIPELMFAYNTAIHDSTGISPAFLNMARNPAPTSTLRRKDELAASNADERAALINWEDRVKSLPQLHDQAAKSAKLAQNRQAEHYDAKRRDVQYEIGDRVWRKNRILSSAVDKVAAKLAPKYAGPYSIVARLGSNVYELADQSNNAAGKVHVVDLKPYHEKGELNTAEDKRGVSPAHSTSARQSHAAATKNKERDAIATAAKTNKKTRGRPRKARLLVARKKVVAQKPLIPSSRPQVFGADAESFTSDESVIAQPIIVHADVHDDSTNAPVVGKRTRGRPKGSKNKAIAPAPTLSPRRTRTKTRLRE